MVLKAAPGVLQNLLDQYEALAVLHEQGDGPMLRQQIDDIGYTLCVTTGTRDVQTALATAREQLAAARPENTSRNNS